MKRDQIFMKSIALVTLVVCCALVGQAGAAEFTFQAADGGGVTFEQRWNQPDNWIYVSGVDDGAPGIPDGTDTFTINRNPFGTPWNDTDLSDEGMPNPHSVGKITGTGAPQRDIVLKTSDTIVGDLEVQASPDTFEIYEERDKSLTINGVISGAGNLVLSRGGGFSDGVTPDETISITGTSPNTITGEMTLVNTNNSGVSSYWVADKVGAFGQTAKLTLEGTGDGLASLLLTVNTIGGEGAIDDDATEVYLGNLALLNVEAGVDEFIGSGKLFTDLTGSGTFSVVPDGVYNSSAAWVTGDGTVTVGVPEPATMGLLAFGALAMIRRRKK